MCAVIAIATAAVLIRRSNSTATTVPVPVVPMATMADPMGASVVEMNSNYKYRNAPGLGLHAAGPRRVAL